MAPPKPITGFTEPEHRALERFLRARTVPLTYEGSPAGVRGTGSFYRVGEDFFLVTAAHVLEGIDTSLLGVPDRPAGNVAVWSLDDVRLYHPKDTENFDVAIIRFLNPNFIERVASNWQYIDDSEIRVEAEDAEEFLVAGYPASTVENRQGTLVPSPILQLFTRRHTGSVDPTPPEYDLLLRYGRTGKAIYGDERATPALHGVSGALVYAKGESNSILWSPDSIFRPVGIQVSMKHDEYIRVKSWRLIHRLVEVIREQGI